MKVFLLLFAGAIPLLIATPSKFLASDSLGEESQPVNAIDPALLRDLASEQAEALNEVGAGSAVPMSPLREANLIGDGSSSDTLFGTSLKTSTAKKWFDESVAGWTEIRDAHAALMSLIAVYDPTFDNAAEEQEALKTFRDSGTQVNALQEMAGGNEIVRQIDLQLKRIDTQIQIKDYIKLANTQYEQKSYQACLKTLQEIVRDDLSQESKVPIDELKRMAEFGEYWQNTPSKTELTTEKLAERREYFRESPAAMTAAERTFLAEVEEELRDDECQLKLKELNEQDFETVASYVATATDVAACPDKQRAVKERTRQWVKQKLTIPSIPTSEPAVQETVRTDGRFMAGVFERGSKMANYYWYWSTLESKRDKKRSNEQPYVKTDQNKGHIVDHPQTPFPIRSVNQFNQERDQLLENLNSESTWREFGQLCNQLDQELQAYRQGQPSGWDEFERAFGDSVPSPKFDEAAKFVDQVLIRWDAFNDLLSESS